MAFDPAGGYAPFWKRAVAGVVDFILWSVASGLLVAFGTGITVALGRWQYTAAIIGGTAVFISVGWLYNALMESSPWQATPGKMLVDIRVCDMRGDPIGFKRATVRYFSKFVSTVLLGLGFVLPFFRPNNQALHDRMARTLVINRS